MIKNKRLPSDTLDRVSDIERLLSTESDVVFAYLFGGLSSGTMKPLSDVDIGVYLSSTADIQSVKTDLLSKITNALATDEVDLVILNVAPLPLRARVIRTKRILKDDQPFLRHRFESLTLREYFDFSYREMQILTRRYSLG